MAIKNYLINDKWLDIDKQNIVEIKSTDGVIGSVKLNGEEYGGGSSDLTWILPEQTVTLVDHPVEITGLRLDLIPIGTTSVPLKMSSGGPTDYYGMIFNGESLQSADDLISITNIDGKDMFAVTDGETISPNTYTISIAVF